MMSFPGLPNELALHVLSFLDFRDLLRCSSVCQAFYKLSKDELFWKMQCRIHWFQESCPSDMSWREYFMCWYKDFGRYLHIYGRVRKAWNQLETFTRDNCPDIFRSLQDGVSEGCLNSFEEKLQVKLPDELRCVYRIHNGQDVDTEDDHPPAGLFGTIHNYDHFRNERMIPLEDMEDIFKTINTGAVGLLPVSSCEYSGSSQYLCVSNKAGFDVGKLYHLSSCQNQHPSHLCDRNSFVAGNSYLDWFANYAQEVANKTYPLVKREPRVYIYKFYQEPGCVAVTGHVRVSVATAFVPEMSKVQPRRFTFAYRVTMSMDSNVSPRHSCQLDTRCWVIKDGDGATEIVNGPGVIGEYPVMKPGAEYSYVSCTNFKTDYGEMSGTYIFRNLLTAEPLEVAVPLFHMRCPEILTAAQRKQKVSERAGSAQ